MRARWLLPVAFLVLLTPFAAAKYEAPEATVGDFWEHRPMIPNESGGQSPGEASRSTVTAFETITIDGTSHEAVRTDQFANQTVEGGVGITTSSHITTWTRRADGAALRTRSTFSYSGLGIPATESTTETTYLQPCLHLRYPFDVGDAWTVECQSRSTTDGGVGGPGHEGDTVTNESYRVRAVRADRVTVPAGTFDAVLIEFNSTDPEGGSFTYYQWYAPAACSFVKGTADIEGRETTSELVAFRCAKGAASSGSGTATPTPATSASTPPTGATPPPTGATPAGTPTTSPAATPAGTPAGTAAGTPTPTAGSRGTDTPSAAVPLVLAAVAALAMLRRRGA